MPFFRTMQEPESTDITQYPGYINLPSEQQKEVAETYSNVFNNNQGKLGYKIAQGIAFTTAKKMCESFVGEAASPAEANGLYLDMKKTARAKAWRATERARSTQTSEDHLKAQKAHVEAAKLHDGAKAKEHRDQAGVHGSIAASNRKFGPVQHKFEEGEFDATRDASPGLVADEAGDDTVDRTISKPGPTYEGEKKKTFCGKKGCSNRFVRHIHPDDKLHPNGLSMGSAERQYGPESDYETHWDSKGRVVKEGEIQEFAVSQTGKRFVMKDGVKHRVIGVRDGQLVTEPVTKSKQKYSDNYGVEKATVPQAHKVTEGDAEDFQAKNDALVGMTEKKDPISGMPTYDLEKTAMMKDIIKDPKDKWKKAAEAKRKSDAEKSARMYETEEDLLSGANPEEDGAARQLRLNHDKMCMGCGVVHPLDVVCYTGRTHSEAGVPGGGNGAADILRQNHASTGTSLGLNVEESDPLISATASYLTNRAKISGLMESNRKGKWVDGKWIKEGAGDIQKKNLEAKCPDCGSLKKDEKCPKCDSDQDVDDKKADDDNEDSEELLKKNHKEKGLDERVSTTDKKGRRLMFTPKKGKESPRVGAALKKFVDADRDERINKNMDKSFKAGLKTLGFGGNVKEDEVDEACDASVFEGGRHAYFKGKCIYCGS